MHCKIMEIIALFKKGHTCDDYYCNREDCSLWNKYDEECAVKRFLMKKMER